MPVKPRSEIALREAMARLLAGKPLHSDGRLKWKNVYFEAGVSKATANRATDVAKEWKAALKSANAPRMPKKVKASAAETPAQVIAGLRDTISVLASRVQAYHLHNESLVADLTQRDVTIAGLRLELARLTDDTTVVPLRPR